MKHRSGTELPGSFKELFQTKEAEYRLFQNYKEPDMDNIDALRWFIDNVGIPASSIVSDDGTRITVSHPEFDYQLVIDCYGAGDTQSHRFEVSLPE